MPSVDQNRRQALNRFQHQSRQLLSDSEHQLVYKVLKDYQRQKRVDRLVRGLHFILRSSPEKLELLRYIRNIIPRYHVQEFDTLMLQQSVKLDRSPQSGRRLQLGVGSLGRHSPTCSNEQLFDAHEAGAETTVVTIHREHGDNSLGFCIRGGSEHGLGIYVSEMERGSIADVAGLEVGDKILEVNNISVKNIASSSAVKVLTGSNHLKLVVERSGKIPEWRFSREKTTWYDTVNRRLISGDFEEFGTMHYIRGLDDVPERRVTLSITKHNKVLGFNIRGGSEYGLGIYVSSIDQGSVAERNGVRVGDQLIDVNGIPFDNITHVHAVEIIKNQTHLILTLRDVGRYPAYKELYAEYTWSSGKRRTRVHVDHLGHKLKETKLADMWIEMDDPVGHRGLHLKVPVEVLSSVNHSHSDIYESVNHSEEGRLQTEIYLPDMENDDDEALISTDHKNDNQDDLDSVNLDMYAKNGGGGHDNPSFIHESTQSLAGSNSDTVMSDTDDESGVHGEYNLTMDDIIARADTSDKKSGNKGENSKTVREDFVDTTSHNLNANTVQEEILVAQSNVHKNFSEPQRSEAVEGDSAVHVLRSNWAEDGSDKEDTPKQGDSVHLEDSAVHVLRPNWTESSSDKHENIPSNSHSNDTEDVFIDQQNFELFEPSSPTIEFNTKTVPTEMTVTSTDHVDQNSSLHSTPVKTKLIVQENVISSMSYPTSSSEQQQGSSSDNRRPSASSRRSVEFREPSESENEQFVLQSFDERIKDLENRQANIGMMELKSLNSTTDKKSPSKNKGSLKKSKWKSIKDKFMGSLRMKLAKRESVSVRKDEVDYYGSIGKKKGVFESAFSPQMVHHNTIDNHSMIVLDDAARKLLEPDEMNAVMKHLQSYHETCDLDRLVEVLLVLFDKPEKMLLLRDIRNVLYPVHMNRFDDMVNSHEVEAYEILSSKLHEQLRQDKNRKPKKHLLMTEVDDHGHFQIKSMSPLSRRRYSENMLIEMKEEKSTNPDELVLNPAALIMDGKKEGHESAKGSEAGSSLTSAESFTKQGSIIAYVSKIKPTLGLCVSGGSDSRKQPVVKVDRVISGGAAADEPRIQPGLIIVSVDETNLLGASHTEAVSILKKSFSNKRRVTMRVILKKDETTEQKC